METLGQARSGGRVSLSTLCPLGLPKKALGLESQIEPWWLCFVHRPLVQFQEPTPVVPAAP